MLGCTLIIIVVFLSGFGGWLAIAGGLATTETDPNLYLFQLFSSQPNSVASLSSWVSLITVMLAAIMNEGAVDSIQNGLASSISSQWLKRQPLLYSRCESCPSLVLVLVCVCCGCDHLAMAPSAVKIVGLCAIGYAGCHYC